MSKPASSMSRPLDWMGDVNRAEHCNVPMPPLAAQRVLQFMFDKRTGNVVLNIRDGEILKLQIEEHVKVS